MVARPAEEIESEALEALLMYLFKRTAHLIRHT